jgi:hypothetical protein
MQTYSELAQALKRADEAWTIAGPQPATRVEELEEKHNIQLPNSFRRFLIEVGRIEYPNHVYTGIDDDYLHPEYGILAHNDMVRAQCGLPEGLLVLEYDHDADELACLDLNQMCEGECPVVWYHLYKSQIIGRCADSFDHFFRRLVSGWTI